MPWHILSRRSTRLIVESVLDSFIVKLITRFELVVVCNMLNTSLLAGVGEVLPFIPEKSELKAERNKVVLVVFRLFPCGPGFEKLRECL